MNLPKNCFVVIVSLFLQFTVQAQTPPVHIAVNDLVVRALDTEQGLIISDRIRTELVNAGRFRVMERGQMDEILKEQGFQQSGACKDEQCMVEMGQLLGVKYIISGTVGKMGSLFTISLKMIDVATGQIFLSVSEDRQCSVEKVLTDFAPEMANRVVTDFRSKITGRVQIDSKPQGALVFVDGKERGQTLCTVDFLEPGSHAVKLTKRSFNDLIDTVLAEQGKLTQKSYTLVPVTSVEKEKNVHREGDRSQIIRKLAFGAGAALCAGAGMYFNKQADDAYQIYSEYEYYDQDIHNAQWDDVVKAKSIRNVMYGLSGASACGLVISFFF